MKKCTKCKKDKPKSEFYAQSMGADGLAAQCKKCAYEYEKTLTATKPGYHSWKSMMTRCYNANRDSWEKYGGAGVTVYEGWHRYHDFIRDVGTPPAAGYTIDRIDNDRGYEPGNVRWATRTTQSRNKRNIPTYEYDGRSLCLSEWSEITGIDRHVLKKRIDAGWDMHLVMTEPSGTRMKTHAK